MYPIMISRLLVLLRASSPVPTHPNFPFKSTGRELMSGFRDAILCIAALNAALLFPVPFIFRARATPQRSPPLQHLLKPLHETPYLLTVLGSAFMMLASVSPSPHPTSFTENQVLLPLLPRTLIRKLQRRPLASIPILSGDPPKRLHSGPHTSRYPRRPHRSPARILRCLTSRLAGHSRSVDPGRRSRRVYSRYGFLRSNRRRVGHCAGRGGGCCQSAWRVRGEVGTLLEFGQSRDVGGSCDQRG